MAKSLILYPQSNFHLYLTVWIAMWRWKEKKTKKNKEYSCLSTDPLEYSCLSTDPLIHMQKRQGKNDSHSKFNKEKAWQRKSERFSKNHSHSSGCFFGSLFVSCTLASFKTGKECRHKTLFENKLYILKDLPISCGHFQFNLFIWKWVREQSCKELQMEWILWFCFC